MKKNEIVLFESKDGSVALPVSVESDTVWLTQAQMAQLFCKDRTVIGRHIRNAISEGEIDPVIMCAKYAHMGKEGDQTYNVDIYNLDVIISVGYRVKSQRGVEFRRWATSVLKEYLIKGYAVNKNRLRQLDQTIEIMKRVSNSLDTEQVLDVVKTYSSALDLLDGYDHQTIEKPKVKGRSVELTYEDCRKFIDGDVGRWRRGWRDPSRCRSARRESQYREEVFVVISRRDAEGVEVIFCCISERDKEVCDAQV